MSKQEDFKKSLKNLREQKLSSLEKENIYKRILNVTKVEPLEPNPKPPRRSNLLSGIGLNTKTILATLIVFLFLTTSVAYASEKSLPGNPLYPIKIILIEPVIGLFKVSEESRFAWNESLVEKRLNEAISLDKKDRLTKEISEKIKLQIKNHLSKNPTKDKKERGQTNPLNKPNESVDKNKKNSRKSLDVSIELKEKMVTYKNKLEEKQTLDSNTIIKLVDEIIEEIDDSINIEINLNPNTNDGVDTSTEFIESEVNIEIPPIINNKNSPEESGVAEIESKEPREGSYSQNKTELINKPIKNIVDTVL